MLKIERLVIMGCGGHARSVADVALTAGFKEILFVDSYAEDGEKLLGFPIQKELPLSLSSHWGCMPAYGDARKRQEAIEAILDRGYYLANLISKTATIGIEAIINLGCFIGHHAHVGPKAQIGQGCIINTAAIVEHDVIIENYTHISVNTTLCGRVSIGERCFIGAGATVIDGVSICSDVMVGAGGVVTQAIKESGIYVGIPARRIKAC